MNRQIKLIWDFKGPNALHIAQHHEIHLQEFISIEKLPIHTTGFSSLNEMHSIAWMVVNESYMISVRDALKPHRGEIYNGSQQH